MHLHSIPKSSMSPSNSDHNASLHTIIIIMLYTFLLATNNGLSACDPIISTVERLRKQQVLASLPPTHEPMPTYGSSQPFLTSPLGKYSALLVRREAAVGAGAYDLCYVQVRDGSDLVVWESDCGMVSDVDSCSLAFTDVGLEMLDEWRSIWEIEAYGGEFRSLDLDDEGDLTIRDEGGEIVWVSSEVQLLHDNAKHYVHHVRPKAPRPAIVENELEITFKFSIASCNGPDMYYKKLIIRVDIKHEILRISQLEVRRSSYLVGETRGWWCLLKTDRRHRHNTPLHCLPSSPPESSLHCFSYGVLWWCRLKTDRRHRHNPPLHCLPSSPPESIWRNSEIDPARLVEVWFTAAGVQAWWSDPDGLDGSPFGDSLGRWLFMWK
uniref:Uncharacterized protein n=1 Tax=Kalanchoe fedtschenkoi TaxID=63787 RepID=A0A7N0T056_KALFE